MPASRLRFFLASEQNRDHQSDSDLVETALSPPHGEKNEAGFLHLKASLQNSGLLEMAGIGTDLEFCEQFAR
jgi:hypothetical protein